MQARQQHSPVVFHWSAGGWFGGQLGGTLWLLILGAALAHRDPVAGGACIGAFLLVNLYGLHLWRKRARISAYAGIQRLLAALSLVIVAVMLVLYLRDSNELPAPGAMVSTHLPYWLALVAPALMLLFHFMKKAHKNRY